jgi:hypothetical protein
VLENLTVKRALTVDGADKRRNAPEYWLNTALLCIRSGALNVGLMKTDNYDIYIYLQLGWHPVGVEKYTFTQTIHRIQRNGTYITIKKLNIHNNQKIN